MANSPTWRKSSRSQNNANCVEVHNTLDQLRDSKNSDGPTLSADVRALVHTIRDGHLRPDHII